jgi:uncharacterized protein YqkB
MMENHLITNTEVCACSVYVMRQTNLSKVEVETVIIEEVALD